MVLAAGMGERMRPITNTIPKPLVKVGGQAMLDFVLDRLADAGVERAVVNVHYLADQIERHLASRGKPQYLRHIPRVWNYLQRSLAHPSLAPLNAWYGVHVPALKL